MSAELTTTINGLEDVQHFLNNLLGISKTELLTHVGNIVIAQTQDRILSSGPSPDGNKWDEWSEKYGPTRHANQSLLMDTGTLERSIDKSIEGDLLIVGTNLEYGGTHQYGDADRNIPARPYLGISTENDKEIADAIISWIQKKVRK